MSYEDDEVPDYVSKRKRLAPPDKHIMNTGERRELTRLQQKSGKTEEELRKDVGVRRKLAAASKGAVRRPAGKPSKKIRSLRHEVAATLGTHINDPRVIPLADQLYNKRYDMWGRPIRWW